MEGSVTKPLFLSASKIDTFQSCSQLYSAKYHWHIPDPGNEGSNRGNVVHEVLELLAKPRHKKRYDDLINHGTCTEVPALWRMIRRTATRWGVGDAANLDMIDAFIMVAVVREFFGPKGTKKVLVEKEFDIQVDEGGKRFNVRGKIDKIFMIVEKLETFIEALDFKSSKAKFTADKLEHNMQSYIYQIALRRMFPDAVLRRFHFLFLKFNKAPVQEQPIFTAEQIDGFEWQLTALQRAMEGFTMENAADHLAAYDDEKKWLCGKEGTNKDGKTAFICTARRPMDYYVMLDENGEWIESAMTEEELHPKDGQVVVLRRYPGCLAFFNPTTGLRRNAA
jgi:ATP-dependent helicase/DNAse subunit B